MGKLFITILIIVIIGLLLWRLFVAFMPRPRPSNIGSIEDLKSEAMKNKEHRENLKKEAESVADALNQIKKDTN
jgi:hypothetical protein